MGQISWTTEQAEACLAAMKAVALADGRTELDTPAEVDRYLDMYANARTLDYGEAGRSAIQRFFAETAVAGILSPVTVDFAP